MNDGKTVYEVSFQLKGYAAGAFIAPSTVRESGPQAAAQTVLGQRPAGDGYTAIAVRSLDRERIWVYRVETKPTLTLLV